MNRILVTDEILYIQSIPSSILLIMFELSISIENKKHILVGVSVDIYIIANICTYNLIIYVKF